MKNNSKLPASLFEHTPWEKTGNSIWPVSTFTLHRNIEKYLFPSKITDKEASQLSDVLQTALLTIKETNQPIFLKAPDISPLDKEYLSEHFLYLEGFQNTQGAQGFFLDQGAQLLGLVNIQDHLQFHLIDSSGEWGKNWELLSRIESGAAINYAFNAKFGYLTSDPGNSGTGLTIRTYLHLPALIHTGQIQEALLKQEEEVVATGMDGSPEYFLGDIVVLSNKYTLGLSEETILHTVHLNTTQLIAAEKLIRTHLTQENPLDMKDHVSRAYGLLLHSHLLQTKEALDALSLIKLGIDLNWISGITDSKINEIFFKCRRAHLAYLCAEEISDLQELPHRRATFIHTQLKELVIKM